MKRLLEAHGGVALVLALGCGAKSEPMSDDASEGKSETGAATSSDDDADVTMGADDESTGDDEGNEDIEKVELRLDAFNIPTTETYYACFEFTLNVDQLHHIVGFEAKIDNAPYVHHYVLSMLDGPSGRGDGYSCFDIDGAFVWAWAPGQTEYWLPEEAGFLIGDKPGGKATLRLQVHYNNPLNTAGQVDSSGLDLFVSKQLRPHHAGALVFGDIQGISIPPGEPAYEHVMRCKSSATAGFMEGPIKVFGSSMHAHEIGSVLWSELWRDGELVQEINRDDPYLFDDQHIKFVDLEIRPGDEVVNRCIYDSTERTSTTLGGPGTRDEMCWNTVVYYPKISSGFSYCTSLH